MYAAGEIKSHFYVHGAMLREWPEPCLSMPTYANRCPAGIKQPVKGSRDMMSIFDDEEAEFNVVMNHEEQYSIWPAHREPPAGWQKVGKAGKKKDCLAYIEEVWTDMRPLSLRKQMEANARQV